MVAVDLDPIPGTNHTPEGSSDYVQHAMNALMGHYNPTVRLLKPEEGACVFCGVEEDQIDPLRPGMHTYWATAEKFNVEPGMYHDSCFYRRIGR